jgi:phosphoglycolate phosphatase
VGLISSFAIDIDGTLTEDGGGRLYLPAIEGLRYLERLGYNIIYVTGRSSIEAYVLATFTGMTRIAVGENGGVVTIAPQEHLLFASKQKCLSGYEILKKNIDGVKIKPVFERMTEVVLFRTFDIEEGRKILKEHNLDLYLSDSKYAFHINQKGVDKATGLKEALTMLKAHAEQTVAIGDSETDIPMFDMCGYSIALCHASDPVKSRAKHVVRGREGIGLVDALDFVTFNYLGLRFKNDISSFSE